MSGSGAEAGGVTLSLTVTKIAPTGHPLKNYDGCTRRRAGWQREMEVASSACIPAMYISQLCDTS